MLWLVGDLAGLPFLGALMKRMAHDDADEAAEIDKQLDERKPGRGAPPFPETGERPSPACGGRTTQMAERFRRRSGRRSISQNRRNSSESVPRRAS